MEDALEADRLYQKALKLAYENEDDPEIGRCLLLSSDLGSVDAAYALGHLSLRNGHEPENERRAFGYMKYAAGRGHVVACYNTAVSFEKGQGTVVSKKCAFSYYLLGALQGDADSCFELCRCLCDGIGTERNDELAALFEREFNSRGTFKPRRD